MPGEKDRRGDIPVDTWYDTDSLLRARDLIQSVAESVLTHAKQDKEEVS